MLKVAVFGENGQVAQSLKALNWPAGTELQFFGRRLIDASSISSAKRAVLDAEPDLVLNAAAYTQVDRAESERDAAFALNAELPRRLAQACAGLNVPLVHISTDYVFDGKKQGPYLEADEPNPLGVYGASKLAGDQAIMESEASWCILRISWIFSAIGDTFPIKILRRAKETGQLSVVDDQIGCPTPASAVAATMKEIGLRLIDGDEAPRGLFNYCGDATLSWHGFASRLIEAAGKYGLANCAIDKIQSSELKLAAERPKNSVLSCALIAERCGIRPADVNVGIEETVRHFFAK